MMLHSPLKRNYKQRPDHLAVIYNNNSFSYADLWINVKKIAYWFDNNLEPGATVGILLDNSYEAVIAIYGIIMSNRVCIPLDTDMHERNIKYIVDDASISLILTSSKYLENVKEVNKENKFKIVLADKMKNEDKYNPIERIKRSVSADNFKESEKSNNSNIAFILYTTGTTGPKKGVMLSHANLLAATRNINEYMQIGPWAVESLPMRLSHSFGFARLRCVFDVGGTVILENGLLRPERILSNMKLHKANAISSVPAGFSILLDYYKEQFKEIGSQIRYIEIGSAFMRQNHKDMLMKLCPDARICMHYGLTEASRTTFIEFHSEKGKLHTVGKPTPNVEIRIIDNEGNALSVNETGEILVKGGMVMQGYWNKKKMTNKSLTSGWLHTSDIGMIDTAGYLHLLGRNKEIINIGGLKVAPGEVEEILLKYDGIAEVAVVGMKSSDDISGEMIKAFIVIDDDELSIKDLEKFCLGNMESYKLPNEFEIVESLPKTASGKIQRHLLIQK